MNFHMITEIHTFQKRVNACIGFGRRFKSMNLPMINLLQQFIHTFHKRVNACIGLGRGFKCMNLHMIHLLQKLILFKHE